MSVSARRKREKAERRQAILEAAAEVFAHKGFAQATMDEVAAAAELSKGTLYLYFKNKDDLFLAMAAGVLRQIADRFQAIGEGEGLGADKVRRMLESYAELAQRHPDHFRTMVMFLSSGHAVDVSTPTFAAHRERIEALGFALAGALTEGQRDGSVRTDIDPASIVGQLWGGMFGVVQIYLNRDELSRRMPRPFQFDSFITGYVDLVIDGLRPR